jgi:hypothetical protein
LFFIKILITAKIFLHEIPFFTYHLLAIFSGLSANAQVVINEISYNPPEAGNDSLEYIEIYNVGESIVNLDGWHFTKGIVDTFPNVVLGAGEYFVTAISENAMASVFGVTGSSMDQRRIE